MCDQMGGWRYRSISKTVTVNFTITSTVLEEYSITFLMIHSLIDYAPVVLQSLMFKAYENFVISKIDVFHFSWTETFRKFFLSFLVWEISSIDEYNHGFFSKFRTLFFNFHKLAGENLPTHFLGHSCTPVVASRIP